MSDAPSYTREELLEAVAASPYDYSYSDEADGPGVTIHGVVNYLVEWVEQHKREHLEAGEIYEDAGGRRLLRQSAPWPWFVISWGREDQVAFDGVEPCRNYPEYYAKRPLRKLVPEDQVEALCKLPHEIED